PNPRNLIRHLVSNSLVTLLQRVENLDICIKNNAQTFSFGGLLNLSFNTNVPGSGFLDNSVISTALVLTGQEDSAVKSAAEAAKLGRDAFKTNSPIMTNGANSFTTISPARGSPQPILGE